MDKLQEIKEYVKYRNSDFFDNVRWLINEVERLRKENEDLIYENIKMKDYIKNYGITHGKIKK